MHFLAKLIRICAMILVTIAKSKSNIIVNNNSLFIHPEDEHEILKYLNSLKSITSSIHNSGKRIVKLYFITLLYQCTSSKFYLKKKTLSEHI